MAKKLLFSAIKNHKVIVKVINRLKKEKEISLILHDPTEDFLDLENASDLLGEIDLLIVKVRNECSLDLLHYAKLYNIPTLHDIDTVLLCKNKISLDFAIRKIFQNYSSELSNIALPKSWINSLLDVKKFKKWAFPKLPIVIKSHYQHDKYMRFTFLVKNIEEIDKFCKIYSNFLYYNVYIQKFIECDGIDRKIYVVGDKIFGIKRENPIYVYLRDNPDSIDVDTIERENFKATEDMKNLARILAKSLNLKIFGFDLIKLIDKNQYYLVDLNDFPGLRGINDIENIIVDFLKDYINSLETE